MGDDIPSGSASRDPGSYEQTQASENTMGQHGASNAGRCFRDCMGVTGLAVGLLVAQAARAEVCAAASYEALSNCTTRAEVTVIKWNGAFPTAAQGYANLDLGGRTYVLEAGGQALPLMCISGGGSLTIVGGRVVTPLGGLPADGSALREMSNFYMRLYGDTALRLEGTQLELEALDDDNPQFPTTVVEIRGSKNVISGTLAEASDGAHLELDGIFAGARHPLPHALALMAFDDPNPSSFSLSKSSLFVGPGAVIHDAVWLEEPQEVPQSTVDIRYSAFEPIWGSASGSASTVGITLTESGDEATDPKPRNLAFVRSAGQLQVTSSRFSQLQTWNVPLLSGEEVVLDETMIDGLEDIDSGENQVLVVDGRNVLVQSSLMCDLRGGETLFRGATDDARPGSVYVLNSALWQVDQGLFGMRFDSTANRDESALVAANVTLHRGSTEGRRRFVTYPLDEPDDFPNVVVINAYLQGAWQLEQVQDRVQMERSFAGGSSDPTQCGEFFEAGCTVTPTAHLASRFVETDCTALMDSFSAPLREVWPYTTDPGPHSIAGMVADVVTAPSVALALAFPLQTLSADAYADDARPALVQISAQPGGVEWRFPGTYGAWDGLYGCASSEAGRLPEIGAWSSSVSDASSPDALCSLDLLRPYATTDAAEGERPNDTGELPQASAPDGLASMNEDGFYGFGEGCRYSAAAIWLLLPFGLRRRRDCVSV